MQKLVNVRSASKARPGRTRFFSRLRRKIKRAVSRAVKSVVRGLIDGVKKLFEPLTKFLTKIWDVIRGIGEFIVKLVRTVPKLFTPDLPSLTNMVRSILKAIRRTIELMVVILKWVWKWISLVFQDVGGWLYRAFPESDWRNVDNIFGSSAVWPICTAAMSHTAPRFLPSISRPATGNFFDTFKPTSVSNVLGHVNSYRISTYPYRMVIPFVSGFVAVVVVSPIWLVNLVIEAPRLITDVVVTTTEAVGGMAVELIGTIGDIWFDLMGEMWYELTKPFRYYLNLVRDLVR